MSLAAEQKPATGLMAEQKRQYTQQGYLVFPHLFSRAEVGRWLRRLEELVLEQRPRPAGVRLQVEPVVERGDTAAAGKHKEVVQDESKASYEGWCREAEARVHWAHHVDFVYNIIRGCKRPPLASIATSRRF